MRVSVRLRTCVRVSVRLRTCVRVRLDLGPVLESGYCRSSVRLRTVRASVQLRNRLRVRVSVRLRTCARVRLGRSGPLFSLGTV